MNPAAPTPSIFDTQSLTALKQGLRQDDPQALKTAARQFEAVFLQMVMKSMRASVPQEGMFDSDQTRFYQELLDSQMAQVLAGKGGTGLAAMIERQLSRPDAAAMPDLEGGMSLSPPTRAMPLPSRQAIPLPSDAAPKLFPLESSPVRQLAPLQSPAANNGESSSQAFVSDLLPHAEMASAATGIPARFLVAHAALESGWGKSEPRFADGRPSHNLFGIKAGSQWQGAVVEATTTEYVGGIAGKRIERFRAYGSYAEAFDDYARLLTQTPRYAEVVASRDAAGFARGLQRAGYATDPEYAAKLERVIGSPRLRDAEPPRA
ncbi:MAG: flagellar assembly peptidoglycan hydrolase FlgJ [Rhodocyclaceae bacterium]|jgi:flagellar protein FlgJ|nr:flagellar assembly peptidoglycan hydrolase FlgJ [Rhodocyclaceae bacterium]